jgi:hypothetical protein
VFLSNAVDALSSQVVPCSGAHRLLTPRRSVNQELGASVEERGEAQTFSLLLEPYCRLQGQCPIGTRVSAQPPK